MVNGVAQEKEPATSNQGISLVKVGRGKPFSRPHGGLTPGAMAPIASHSWDGNLASLPFRGYWRVSR